MHTLSGSNLCYFCREFKNYFGQLGKVFSICLYNVSFQLLGAMQELIDNPLNVNPRLIENWKEVSDSETYMLSMFLYKFSSFLYA
jgi:hypothetical protein